VYEVLFKRVVRLRHEAALREREGLDATSLRNYIPEKLGLDGPQAMNLFEVATQCLSDARELDKRASEIIRSFRDQYPKGRFDSRLGFPKAPTELGPMQNERNNLFMKGKDMLRATYGDPLFSAFETMLHEMIPFVPDDNKFSTASNEGWKS
jgi:hypothetical protein